MRGMGAPRHQIRDSILDLAVPWDSLTPHPDNPNDGDQDAIAESLTINGQYRPIVAWRRPDGPDVILAGNTTWAAAGSLGWDQIAATFIDADTEEEAARILLADNRYARLARMNQAAELELLRVLESLAGSGYTPDDIEELQRRQDVAAVIPLNPEAEWERAGMPGYTSQDLTPAYRAVVAFRTEADADRFFEEVFGHGKRDGQQHNPGVSSVWWPESDGRRGSRGDLRAVADDG